MNKAIVVKPNNETDVKFLFDLFSKLGVSSKVIDGEMLEDIGLAELMKSVNRGKKVSRKTIIKKLDS